MAVELDGSAEQLRRLLMLTDSMMVSLDFVSQIRRGVARGWCWGVRTVEVGDDGDSGQDAKSSVTPQLQTDA